jgi:hypothetical protein
MQVGSRTPDYNINKQKHSLAVNTIARQEKEFEGTGPLEGVSEGMIWREAIRLAGIVCAQ